MVKNDRFMFVLTDSRGVLMRRRVLTRRGGYSLAALAIVFVSALGMLVFDSIQRYPLSIEVQQLRTENQQLREVLSQSNTLLPEINNKRERLALIYSQVWAKTGLGVKPPVLPVGPVDADPHVSLSMGAVVTQGIDVDTPPLKSVQLLKKVDSLNQQSGKLLETLDSLAEYFRDAEKLLSHTPALRPTPSMWVTSRFGIRHDPIHRSQMLMHKGLDLGGPSGMPIYAPAKGRVIFIGNRGGYGRVVILDHGYGIQTHYAHLSAYRVSVGGTVKRGQLIALMGNTGKSTGPHLHYEVRRNGLPLDPELFILD